MPKIVDEDASNREFGLLLYAVLFGLTAGFVTSILICLHFKVLELYFTPSPEAYLTALSIMWVLFTIMLLWLVRKIKHCLGRAGQLEDLGK